VKNLVSQCIWDKDKLHQILEILSQKYTINLNEFVVGSLFAMDKPNYFEVLIAIILSQNTNDINAIQAFKNLKNSLKSITAKKIIETSDDYLAKLIRVAGLTYRRVRILKDLAMRISAEPGFFVKLEGMDTEQARKILLSLPGVGFKTADVFLLMILNRPTFPIDTHINRVVRRLGLASPRDNYEAIRNKVMNLLENDVEKLRNLHFLLITHGRKVCKARNPQCSQCDLANICCRIIQ
jgi:endonuclease-3